MIGARELIMAGVDAAAIVDEHEDGYAAMRAAGIDPIELTRYAEYSVQKYPEHLIRCHQENGMSYQDSLIACFAAAWCEGAIAAARAVREEAERDA